MDDAGAGRCGEEGGEEVTGWLVYIAAVLIIRHALFREERPVSEAKAVKAREKS